MGLFCQISVASDVWTVSGVFVSRMGLRSSSPNQLHLAKKTHFFCWRKEKGGLCLHASNDPSAPEVQFRTKWNDPLRSMYTSEVAKGSRNWPCHDGDYAVTKKHLIRRCRDWHGVHACFYRQYAGFVESICIAGWTIFKTVPL